MHSGQDTAQHVGALRRSQELSVLGPQWPGVLSVHPQGGGPEVHEVLQTLSCAQGNAGQATGQVSRAAKMSISAEMSALSTKLMLCLITVDKPPLE